MQHPPLCKCGLRARMCPVSAMCPWPARRKKVFTCVQGASQESRGTVGSHCHTPGGGPRKGEAKIHCPGQSQRQAWSGCQWPSCDLSNGLTYRLCWLLPIPTPSSRTEAGSGLNQPPLWGPPSSMLRLQAPVTLILGATMKLLDHFGSAKGPADPLSLQDGHGGLDMRLGGGGGISQAIG